MLESLTHLFEHPMMNVLLVGLLIVVISTTHAQPQHYPETRRVDVTDTLHGIAVKDPYRWLEIDTASEVEEWVGRQQSVTEAYLSTIPYRSALKDRIRQVTTFNTMSNPWHRAGLTFFYSSDGVRNHAVLYVKKDTMLPKVLIDPNTFSDDGTIALAFAQESLDGKYLAFGKSQAGSDWHDIYVLEIATGKILTDTLRWVKNSGVSWQADGFYYSRYESADNGKSLSAKNTGQFVCYHKVGTKQNADKVVYRDLNHPERYVGIYIPEKSPLLVMHQGDGSSKGNKIFVRPINDTAAPWKLIFSNEDASFYPSVWHDSGFIGTTTLDAPNERVVRIADPFGDATITTIIPEGKEPISSLSWGGGKLFISRIVDVHDRIDVYDPKGNHIGEVKLPGNGNAGGFNGYVNDTILYYSYSSFTYPTTIFQYNVHTGESKAWYKVRAPFNPDEFVERQVFVTSKDGTRIPMFLLHKKDIVFNGTAPTMMFGYGGFGITYGPGFNAGYIPWLEQGGVIAIPNLRGGGEYGEKWHDAGRKENKQNVFDDAIACAEWLVSEGITSKGRLAVNGRSNGGLLVGALITQRPDLFRVAVPEVGVMDMLRYHLFTIGHGWVSDYGSVDVEREFNALYAYSPLHNVRSGVEYPSTMVMTSDHDDRVVPAHSFKFAAELQHRYAGNRPMLLRVETKSGHGAVNREKSRANLTDKYAFMWHEMGFTPHFEEEKN
ncbi:MAG: S9 family peptidase [Ignavibacteria bacterium]|nr:S9 family peptidase [Ignavibacteria bacterium]